MSYEITRLVLGLTNCFLIRQDGVIIIDAGDAHRFKAFTSRLDRLGIEPEEIRLILLTHAHGDHVGLVSQIKELSGARVAIHRKEKDWLERGLLVMPEGLTAWGRVMEVLMEPLKGYFRFRPAKAEVIIGDVGCSLAEYGIAGKVVHTPGHSPGSVSVLLEDGKAIVGDIAMNGLPFRFGPGLPVLGEDMELIRESWRKLLKEQISTIYPGHGKPFPVRVMRRIIT